MLKVEWGRFLLQWRQCWKDTSRRSGRMDGWIDRWRTGNTFLFGMAEVMCELEARTFTPKLQARPWFLSLAVSNHLFFF